MSAGDRVVAASPGQWDPLVSRLQGLRKAAGSPSFGRIAGLVVQRRVHAGASPASAHLARSTVFDVFRLGRTRLNLDLVREVALVLGAADADIDRWIAECRDPEPPGPRDRPAPGMRTARDVVVLMCACIAANLAGREFVDYFGFPIYLDMVGTAVAAVALGPWRGAAVGGVTNVVGVVGSGWISLPFGIVNVAGALVWGYGVHRWGLGRTLARFFLLSVATAVACTLLAVPVIMVFGDHDLRVGHDVITQLVQDAVSTFPVALGLSNILTSLTDKLLSGFVALVAVTSMPWRIREGLPLVLVDQRPAP